MKKVKTAFFGSSKYSVPYLEAIYKNPLIDLSLVVSSPDKPFGRGLTLLPSPVKVWARERKILTLTPSDLSEGLFLGALKTLPLKMGLMAYYGLKIPKEVIEQFPLGILNVHHSLLPRHRGGSPIPWTILSGDPETGTTIIKIGEKFDDGEIVGFAKETVRSDDTTEALRPRLDQLALDLLEKILPKYLEGKISPRRMRTGEGSYDPKPTRDTGRIDWKKSGAEIERMVRAFNPWPGTWTTLDELCSSRELKTLPAQAGLNSKLKDKRIKILKSHLEGGQKLAIDEVQVEGKTPIGWEEFRSGYLQ